MRISARADYAVRALLELTVRQGEGPPVKAEAIATAQDIPHKFLEGILGDLRRGGIVDSRREGTWVYYAITEQEHATVAKALDVLTTTFGAERALRVDHAKLRKSCGPSACAS